MLYPGYNRKKIGIYLYVLDLQNGKRYVGISNKIYERFRKHKLGKTCDFVKQNLPIKKFNLEFLESMNRKEALIAETKKTMELINTYGIENVYGGAIVGEFEKRKKIYQKKITKDRLID